VKRIYSAVPRLAKRILKFLFSQDYYLERSGDLEEAYGDLVEESGLLWAKAWLWFQILKLFYGVIRLNIVWRFIMLKNYFKTGIRTLLRHKGYSTLNIIGLAVGLAVCILIFLWVQDELGYDRFHTNADRIYRVIEHEELSSGEILSYSQQGPALAPILKADYPEILESVRFRVLGDRLVKFGDHKFYEKGFAFADPAILTMFTFPLKIGDPASVLTDPSSIVISENMARKYFENKDPIGKILRVDNHTNFIISGVMENIPSNSHLKFDFLAKFDSIKNFGQPVTGWDSFYLDTYVLLAETADHWKVDQKIKNVISEHSEGSSFLIDLQSLTRIRLFSNAILTPRVDGDIKYVVIFSLIAVFILLNACINFMNLTTARSGQRAREIGMRKVVGARRKELVHQFFGESLLMAFISLVFALGLVLVFLPLFNQLSGKDLPLMVLGRLHVILGLLGITLTAGLISGIYPALFLSSFQPVSVLKNTFKSGLRGNVFRRALVIFQFVLTTVLIIGTVVVYRQFNFLRQQNLGYEKEQVMCIRLPGNLRKKTDLMKTTFERIPGVLNTAAASTVPGRRRATLTLENWEGRDSEDRFELGILDVDLGFLSTFELKMAEGRFFSRDFITDEQNAVVVNEAAIRASGMKDPVGKWILGPDLKIIGVIKDFNLRTLHHKVAPLVIGMRKSNLNHLFVKITAENMPRTIASLKSSWNSLVPEYPFDFKFLDEHLEELYRADQRIGNIINAFAGLALFVACLGLFGLASFVAERRTKEIGIRKILGASNPVIFHLLARDFIKWILLANLIAAPIAAYATMKYLKIYAYHIKLGPMVFLIPGLLTLLVSLLTISWQAIRAATTDPVKSLKYE
jgi:ABC-type antimicrobial peptide transport system permease subunit